MEDIKQPTKTLHIKESVKNTYISRKLVFTLGISIAAYFVFYLLSLTQNEGEPWGWKSILPTLSVLIIAVLSRRPFEAMMAGIVAGLIMLNPTNIINSFSENISAVMGNETIIWIILVCGLMGGLIQILEISNSLNGFTQWLKTKIKSRRQSMVTTVALGAVIFIDDYLSCLAVSSSVKKLTDYYQVSREKIAYLIDSAAAPMCVIVPISTWAVFFSGLLEENGIADANQGISLYISSIPFMMYAWVALIVAFLVAFGVIGDWGAMKKAEQRAKNGHPIPEDFEGVELTNRSMVQKEVSLKTQLFNFLFPIGLLILSTVYYDVDLLKGVIITIVITSVMYYLQGLLSIEQQVNAMFEGFNTMLYPLSTVIGGFLLKEINDNLGMTEYIIESVTPYLSAEIFPAIVFVLLSLIVFGTASSWGVFVIAIPIVIPVALALDVHMPLVIGSLISASAFGSHACFFSDSSILASQGAGCSPMNHAFTQFPYALFGAFLSIAAFIMLGFTYA